MNHRERILAALRHEEPDRVPLDFGGTCDSSIMAVNYQKLRKQLGLPPSVTYIVDIFQQTALIEDDVRRALGIDTMPIFDEPREWRADRLANGDRAALPDKFRPTLQDDGSQVTRDAAGNVVLKMPAGGHYFDPVYSPLAGATSVTEIERYVDEIENYDTPAHLDKTYAEQAARAKELRENTDYLLVGFFGGHIFQAGQSLRGWEQFLVDLLTNKKFAHALMDKLTEGHIKRFARYAATVGKYVDVIHFEDDLGMQDRPLLKPALYREMVKPYQQRLFNFVKSRCDAHILLHTDGAVAPFIPDFIEMGIDAVNPIQVSAAGMEPRKLKREYGKDITFWGAGCESQQILPFGTPQEVADEVTRRIDELAPGGGFVFCPIHNVQAEVPVENVVAMFETAKQAPRPLR